MFNGNDFPDRITESAYIRERHGPPPPTPEESAAQSAEWERIKAAIQEAYAAGSSVAHLVRRFRPLSEYRVRQFIGEFNFKSRFPDQEAKEALRQQLGDLCYECYGEWHSGPWCSWLNGQRLKFPEPKPCFHENPMSSRKRAP